MHECRAALVKGKPTLTLHHELKLNILFKLCPSTVFIKGKCCHVVSTWCMGSKLLCVRENELNGQ